MLSFLSAFYFKAIFASINVWIPLEIYCSYLAGCFNLNIRFLLLNIIIKKNKFNDSISLTGWILNLLEIFQ